MLLQLPRVGALMSSCHPWSYLDLSIASLLSPPPRLHTWPLNLGGLPWPSQDSSLAGISTITALTTLCDQLTASPMDTASRAHSRHLMSKLSHQPWPMSSYLAIFLEPSEHEREGLLLAPCLFPRQ